MKVGEVMFNTNIKTNTYVNFTANTNTKANTNTSTKTDTNAITNKNWKASANLYTITRMNMLTNKINYIKKFFFNIISNCLLNCILQVLNDRSKFSQSLKNERKSMESVELNRLVYECMYVHIYIRTYLQIRIS